MNEKPEIDRRMIRARRDAAAYRIASAIADELKPEEKDLIEFRAARHDYRAIIKSMHPSMKWRKS